MNLENKQLETRYFKLYANCLLVKGASKSSICDLQRHTIHLIPNDLYELLSIYQHKSIAQIKKIYGKENSQAIDKYFEFLDKNELVFFCNKEDLVSFPSMDITYYEPSIITNAILDFNSETNYDYKSVFVQLSELGCKAIQMRFFEKIAASALPSILEALKGLRINCVELYIKFDNELEDGFFSSLIQDHLRITQLIIHSAPLNKVQPHHLLDIYYTTEEIQDNTHCGVISSAHFSINIKTFTEAQQHNSCLNRKISIDVNGDIKNCPSSPQSFGNIAEVSLQNALLHKNFKDLWLINKDQIEVCKDCEFRYICTDCRAFITNPEDKYSKPSKCSYNPYTAEWEN